MVNNPQRFDDTRDHRLTPVPAAAVAAEVQALIITGRKAHAGSLSSRM